MFIVCSRSTVHVLTHTDNIDIILSDSGCIVPLNRTSNISYFFFIHLSHLSHHFHVFPLSSALTPYTHTHTITHILCPSTLIPLHFHPSLLVSLPPPLPSILLSGDAGHTGKEAAGGMVVDNYLVFGAPQESGPSGEGGEGGQRQAWLYL